MDLRKRLSQHMIIVAIGAFALLCVGISCSASAIALPSPTSTQLSQGDPDKATAKIQATPSLESALPPTVRSYPTETSAPTQSPTATLAPTPTDTAPPSETPAPTATTIPQTATAIANLTRVASTSAAKTETAGAKMSATAAAKGRLDASSTARAATQFAKLHPSPTPLPNFVPILGKIWTGVQVYYGKGASKAYGFEIRGGSEHCPSLPSGRGLRVRYPNGTEEWKDRDYIVGSGLFFVVAGDPAIDKMEWYVYSYCP